MKRSTALKNLASVVNRVRDINGIYPTPLCDNEFVKVKRIWVFGSVAKGVDNPNDLDIFIELRLDRYRRHRKGRYNLFRNTGSRINLHGAFKASKASLRSSVPITVSSRGEFDKWVRRNLPKTSIHFFGDDNIFDTLDCKYLVYPRNDFADLTL